MDKLQNLSLSKNFNSLECNIFFLFKFGHQGVGSVFQDEDGDNGPCILI